MKVIETVLFILFTDADSFTYSTTKPDVDDCKYILGRFCKRLVEEHTRSFGARAMADELKSYCKERLISVDTDAIIDILLQNHILVAYAPDAPAADLALAAKAAMFRQMGIEVSICGTYGG